MGGGLLDAEGQPAEMSRHGFHLGGQSVTSHMMGGMHSGQPVNLTGSYWSDPAGGHYMVEFAFTT